MKMTKSFVQNIRQLIVSARKTVSRGVDLVQVHVNFEIGRRIVEEEQRGKDRAAYGQEVIRVLADRLTKEFGRGFSASNLAYMRTFYLAYEDRGRIFQTVSGKLPQRSLAAGNPQAVSTRNKQSGAVAVATRVPAHGEKDLAVAAPNTIFQTASGKLSESPSPPFTVRWSHYVFLMSIRNPAERSFYEIESTSEDWTVRELERQFDSCLYERLALSRDKEGIRRLAREGQVVARPQDILKEPLVLEFLGLEERDRYTESDLEAAILERIEQFLLELGKGFLFEERQRRFTFDGAHYFVDLVFYNRLLRCYVLLDLKLGRLTHKDLGQMQMYVNYFDENKKLPGENDTIGIILCKQKSREMVRITLPKGVSIHAPEYQLYLPGKAELQRKLAEWVSDAKEALQNQASAQRRDKPIRRPRARRGSR